MNKKIKNLYAKLDKWDINTIRWIRKTRPTIYTTLEHVSNSGMFRIMGVHAIKNNKPLCLNSLVEKLTGYKRDRHKEGLRVSGCGMNMGFAVVYSFSSAAFPTGFKYRKNEHHRNGDPSTTDKDGGYALRQVWF